MAGGSRRWLHGLVGSAVMTALAVAVNLATEWKTNWWAWLGVLALTIVGFVIGAYLYPLGERSAGERRSALVHERVTKRGWVSQEVDSTSVENAVLVVTDRWPDGRVSTTSTDDKDVARHILELRSFEISREREIEG